MADLAALAVFALVTVLTWLMAVAVYHLLTSAPDLRQTPSFGIISGGTILLVTLLSFIPFPAGYLLSLVFWWLAAKNFLELPLGRAVLLFLILAAMSMVSRLALLCALHF
jgi:hypothetical protein